MLKDSTVSHDQQIRNWIIWAFYLPEGTQVTVSECKKEEQSYNVYTVAVYSCKNHSHEHIIPKPIAYITSEDIELLRTTDKHYIHKNQMILGYLFRFTCWWLTFSGLYAMSILCPCCGQLSWPFRITSATLVGGIFAIFRQSWSTIAQFIRTRLIRV
jgi:hypothetical protein